MGHGAESRNISIDWSYKQLSATTTLHLGLLINLLPFPKKFDNIKFVQGLTYFYEERYILNTISEPNWNGKHIGKGFNYTVGLDLS